MRRGWVTLGLTGALACAVATACAETFSARIVLSEQPVPGVNFTSLQVSGRVTWQGTSAPSGATNLCLVATGESGTSVTQKFSYAANSTGAFSYAVSGLDAGLSFVISAYAEIGGKAISTACNDVATATARTLAWIDENVATFTGSDDGTGDWYATNGISSVEGETIRFEAEDWTSASYFDPTNVTVSVQSSCVRDFRFTARFDYPGYYADETEPEVPSDLIASVTLRADANDVCSLAVVTNGAWAVVPRSTFAPSVGTDYSFLVRFDYGARKVVYALVEEATSNFVRLASCDLPADADRLLFEFAGTGGMDELVGCCHDANLVLAANAEYADMDAARAAVGEQKNLQPLWWSDYALSGSGGTFRLVDPNGYLNLSLGKCYHYTVSDEEGVKVYRYLAGNNWIEYADASGVEPITGGWHVKNEAGLAYLAECATNGWLSGDVYLDADLDLSARNWTPIASFTGTFDGQGHTIVGLNNTNVVTDNGLVLRYPGGVTNDWGYVSYGLFGCATNALFCDVAFANVAISNEADSVAALLGVHAGGALEVANVTNESGIVAGSGRAVAGLLTLGGAGVAMDDVVVTGNVNRATVAGTIANDDDGGNVAQILAGTTWGTKFDGKVVATNNVGEGTFDVVWLGHDGSTFDLPVCNFAAAVTRMIDDDYRRFVEANSPKAVPVDPVRRTARMLARCFMNGDENLMGTWMDAITAAEDGDKVTIQGTGKTYEGWSTIEIDRDLTIDMNKNGIYCIYDCDVFNIADGVSLTIGNGTVQYVEGCSAFAGDTSGLSKGLDLTEKMISGSFYDRTAIEPISAFSVANGRAKIDLPFTSSECWYTLQSKTSLSDAWEDLAESEGGGAVTFEPLTTAQSGFYRVCVDAY